MRTHSVLFILALVTICSVAKKSMTQTKVNALYTCRNVSLNKSTLTADCQTADKKRWPTSSVNLSDCLGNNDGNFKTKSNNQRYWETCFKCSLNNGTLSCTCKTRNHDDNKTSIAINTFISNWNGKLACD
jgi:hypothetical protein